MTIGQFINVIREEINNDSDKIIDKITQAYSARD